VLVVGVGSSSHVSSSSSRNLCPSVSLFPPADPSTGSALVVPSISSPPPSTHSNFPYSSTPNPTTSLPLSAPFYLLPSVPSSSSSPSSSVLRSSTASKPQCMYTSNTTILDAAVARTDGCKKSRQEESRCAAAGEDDSRHLGGSSGGSSGTIVDVGMRVAAAAGGNRFRNDRNASSGGCYPTDHENSLTAYPAAQEDIECTYTHNATNSAYDSSCCCTGYPKNPITNMKLQPNQHYQTMTLPPASLPTRHLPASPPSTASPPTTSSAIAESAYNTLPSSSAAVVSVGNQEEGNANLRRSIEREVHESEVGGMHTKEKRSGEVLERGGVNEESGRSSDEPFELSGTAAETKILVASSASSCSSSSSSFHDTAVCTAPPDTAVCTASPQLQKVARWYELTETEEELAYSSACNSSFDMLQLSPKNACNRSSASSSNAHGSALSNNTSSSSITSSDSSSSTNSTTSSSTSSTASSSSTSSSSSSSASSSSASSCSASSCSASSSSASSSSASSSDSSTGLCSSSSSTASSTLLCSSPSLSAGLAGLCLRAPFLTAQRRNHNTLQNSVSFPPPTPAVSLPPNAAPCTYTSFDCTSSECTAATACQQEETLLSSAGTSSSASGRVVDENQNSREATGSPEIGSNQQEKDSEGEKMMDPTVAVARSHNTTVNNSNTHNTNTISSTTESTTTTTTTTTTSPGLTSNSYNFLSCPSSANNSSLTSLFQCFLFPCLLLLSILSTHSLHYVFRQLYQTGNRRRWGELSFYATLNH